MKIIDYHELINKFENINTIYNNWIFWHKKHKIIDFDNIEISKSYFKQYDKNNHKNTYKYIKYGKSFEFEDYWSCTNFVFGLINSNNDLLAIFVSDNGNDAIYYDDIILNPNFNWIDIFNYIFYINNKKFNYVILSFKFMKHHEIINTILVNNYNSFKIKNNYILPIKYFNYNNKLFKNIKDFDINIDFYDVLGFNKLNISYTHNTKSKIINYKNNKNNEKYNLLIFEKPIISYYMKKETFFNRCRCIYDNNNNKNIKINDCDVFINISLLNQNVNKCEKKYNDLQRLNKFKKFDEYIGDGIDIIYGIYLYNNDNYYNKFLYQLVFDELQSGQVDCIQSKYGNNIKISNKYFNNSELFIDNKINKVNNIINNDIIQKNIYNYEDVHNDTASRKINTFHYIYIIRCRESCRLNENIYKIGKTCQYPFNRIKQYPKNSEIVLILKVDNCHVFENILLKELKKKFKYIKEYGNEYFEDNSECNDIINIVLNIYNIKNCVY